MPTKTTSTNLKKILPANHDIHNKALPNLRIADLELFITAANLKNLSLAAQLHHTSQSAASTALQRVEAALGIPLCLHAKRLFKLTSEGQILFPKLDAWLKNLKEIAAMEKIVPIRIATTHAIAQVIMPAILPFESLNLQIMRPDYAYGAVLHDEADLAIVLDNAPWEGVIASEIAKGSFQLFSSEPNAPQNKILLPENQIEVLSLQQRWQQVYQYPLPIKSRIPSWSLIADICSNSKEIGFLPDFLAKKYFLHPVLWQPATSQYRMLALYKNNSPNMLCRINNLIKELTILCCK